MKINKIFGLLIFISLGLIILYSIYSRFQISKFEKKTVAVAIEPNGYRINRYAKDWLFACVVEERIKFVSFTDLKISKGDCYSFSYNEKNHNSYFFGKKIESIKDILVFGDNFPKQDNQLIRIYFKTKLIKERNISSDFGFFVPFSKDLRIEYISSGDKIYEVKLRFVENTTKTLFHFINYNEIASEPVTTKNKSKDRAKALSLLKENGL